MEKLKASYIAKVSCGELIGADVEIRDIVRDTREVYEGCLFVAIRGERFDGHDFVLDAINAGASAVLVSRELRGVKIAQIVVSDTVEALGKIAEAYIKTLPAKRVCVTGSVGKTTTKEMCAAVLSKSFKTHKTEGNYNNNIGLPLTAFGMDKSHEAAVLEIGTNHFGEILPLAKIASPHVAIITVIGESHLEAFGTKEGVLREKTEVFGGLVDGGVAILNGDDPLLWGIRDSLKHKAVWYGIGNCECDVFGEIVENTAFSSSFKVRGSETLFTLSSGGEHNVRNALSAIAVGRAFGMHDDDIKEGLSSFVNTGMRQKVYELSGVTVIEDCYNANPESMKAAFSLLSEKTCRGKKICVLGDMLELGENAPLLHRKTGEEAGKYADRVLATGDFAKEYMLGAGKDKTEVFDSKEALARRLSEILDVGDMLLIKGSYGTKMWQVIEYLQMEKE